MPGTDSSLLKKIPDMADVLPAMERVLSRPPFHESPQLSAFLKFVVTETLAGKGNELKGYTIATMALGRPADFDPQIDPIVRVQAGRVRQALDEYYLAHSEETIRIHLDKGSYVPRFLKLYERAGEQVPVSVVSDGIRTVPDSAVKEPIHTTVATDNSLPKTIDSQSAAHVQPSPEGRKRDDGRASGFRAVLGILTIGILLALTGMTISGLLAAKENLPEPFSQVSYLPLVVVDNAHDPAAPSELASLVQRTQDAIARFDDLIVVMDNQDEKRVLPFPPVRRQAERLLLRIFGVYADRGRIRFSARLTDSLDQRVIWAQEFEPVLSGTAGDDARSEIIRTIATTIARPYGVVHAYARQIFTATRSPQSDFGCISTAFDYWVHHDRAKYLAARQCIAEQIEKSPNIGSLHAQMTYLYLDEYRSGQQDLPKPPLDRALASANRAVALSPYSARSYQALMAVHFIRKEMESGWRSAEQARSLNPFDSLIQADVAVRKMQVGQVEKGLAELEDAIKLTATPSDWATTYRALGHYSLGKNDQADALIKTVSTSEFPLAMFGNILVSLKERDRPGTIEKLNAFKARHPVIYADPKSYLERMNFDHATIFQYMMRYRQGLDWVGQAS